jgi:inner membrane protein
MASIGHLAVGLAAGRIHTPGRLALWTWTGLLVGLSYLPDVDVLGFRFGIPYGAPFGHRGALHSLPAALLCAGVMALVAWCLGLPAAQMALISALVVASHGILDTFTDGGLGIALLWPFNSTRYFAPWRPIPAAPIGWRILSAHGLALMAHEALLFAPLFLLAAWPRRSRNQEQPNNEVNLTKRDDLL